MNTMKLILHRESRIEPGTDGKSMVDFMEDRFGNDTIAGVEVGVYAGAHARYMLNKLNLSKLYLVDPYVKYDEYRDGPSEFLDIAKLEAHRRLAPYTNIEWIYEMSDVASNIVPCDMNFVYLDANHDYHYTSRDISMWYPHVIVGGIFGGHDYTYSIGTNNNRSGWPSVKQAVDEFLDKYNYTELHVTNAHNPDWYVIKK